NGKRGDMPMIHTKLNEALAEIPAQRRALDEIEVQIRSMIAKLSGMPTSIPSAAVGTTAARPIAKERDKIEDVADVLRAEGKPLHITVIAERLSVVYGKKVLRTEIEPGLNRHISKVQRRRIEKFGRSVFGLPEWKL